MKFKNKRTEGLYKYLVSTKFKSRGCKIDAGSDFTFIENKKVIVEFHYNNKTLKLINKKNNKNYVFNDYFEAKDIWNIIVEKV